MLTITIPAIEMYDEVNNEFIATSKEVSMQLEHSLVSISKWEATWQKPFLSKETKTIEESIDYIKCMTITQNIKDEVYRLITDNILRTVSEYIENGMTATRITKNNKSTNKEIMTSEVIYYYMTELNIPFECQKWHLNRLLTLIDICSIKRTAPKKGSQKELLSRNTELNAARRAANKTSG